MSSILNAVDQRTRLVGENRLELLMFRLGSRSAFAINVFKVKEVISVPALRTMPGAHSNLSGVRVYRGVTIPVIDLRQAIKIRGNAGDRYPQNVIITEYNRSVQGFLIGEVLSIVNTSWEQIVPPPKSIGKANYLTAITQREIRGENTLVEIIDVEKVLAEIIHYDANISKALLEDDITGHLHGKTVLVVDDSATARRQIKDTLCQLGINIIERQNGAQALALLKQWVAQGRNVDDEILMMFTDAEMPEMDGYRLTAEIRNDSELQHLYIALNTSLSGSFNDAMVEKVGCNRFISKFQPDMLVDVVQQRMREVLDAVG